MTINGKQRSKGVNDLGFRTLTGRYIHSKNISSVECYMTSINCYSFQISFIRQNNWIYRYSLFCRIANTAARVGELMAVGNFPGNLTMSSVVRSHAFQLLSRPLG